MPYVVIYENDKTTLTSATNAVVATLTTNATQTSVVIVVRANDDVTYSNDLFLPAKPRAPRHKLFFKKPSGFHFPLFPFLPPPVLRARLCWPSRNARGYPKERRAKSRYSRTHVRLNPRNKDASTRTDLR